MNMADMFGKIAEMQQKVAETQEALAARTVTVEAGGGMVTVTANGAGRVTAIKVDPEAIDPGDQELMEDLIVAGVNKALDEAEAMRAEEMRNVAGGLLPPGMDLSSLGMDPGSLGF